MVVHDISKIVLDENFEARRADRQENISFRDVTDFLRRHTALIGSFGAIGLALGVFYILNTSPSYTATARLVIDPEQGRIASQDASTGTIIIEAAEIASQVEIVKSEAIARAVIEQLNLTKDPEIVSTSSWMSSIKETVKSVFTLGAKDEADNVPDEEYLMRRTMATFLSRMTVRRVGQSYVLEIGYTSLDPQKAAKTTNAIAMAYIKTGLNERAEAARSGARWLESRLMEIGEQARAAAMTVEDFRAMNDITTIGTTSTLEQQQLSELSSQMLAARAATAAESAKLMTFQEVIASGSIMADIDEGADNPQLQKLRDEMRAATSKLENLKARYHEGNPAIVAAKAEIERLEAAMRAEFQRIERLLRSHVDIAQTREKLLETELAKLTAAGAGKNVARVELSEMESRATTYRNMYEGVLQQLIGALQTQSFPLGKARIVMAATAPLGKTWPKPSTVLPLSLALGLGAGLVMALMRDGLDRRVSSSERLRAELGIASLGHVPVYRGGPRPQQPAIASTMLPLRSVLDMPYSRFSEALRGVKNSIDSAFPANATAVVGVTSVGPGEGKTTIAANLAQLYMNEGTSVLLVDADFIGSRLSRVTSEDGANFGMESLRLIGISGQYSKRRSSGETPNPEDFDGKAVCCVPVLTVDQTRKAAVAHQRYGHLPALKAELELLRQRYKVIIVDMSGFEDSADTRVICTYLDGIVVVLGQSDKMTVERLAEALSTFGKSRVALLGVISNRSEGPRRAKMKDRKPWRPSSM
ncbi:MULTISPECIES: GumC family protein [Sinorhizobium]|uniref:Lipopolysaccharide biosynthesis protein n=2 Tax=Sinorhizobium TaxID=28105 RepID=A0A2S3YS89_9HYPH|nr:MULTISPECIES: exopolysaccharide transport family protein [Sinorhizobium]ASY59895.1 Tyrosine-protein kinase Wzc [Sinorhizobium sp. CCBAU 05631]AUX80111.1 lipopolysaccharide biosynthesis protein [Sinorhizobium fredii]PDT43503.1 lipopolysaccharide biosynthesis protein [Sinorhizobium sp. FG01]POH34501.1 lipopolysaccharide biosynthesis protein [Sinorhizobium americanum]